MVTKFHAKNYNRLDRIFSQAPSPLFRTEPFGNILIIVESATALAVLLPVRRAVEQCAIQQLFICQLLVGVVDVVQQLQCVELYTLVPMRCAPCGSE